jgi:hypothetical protein
VPRVAIKTGHGPATVEGFPASAKRSCEGALHLHPGHFRDVTADELERIREDGVQVNVLADAPAGPVTAATDPDAPELDLADDAAPKRKRAKKPQPE